MRYKYTHCYTKTYDDWYEYKCFGCNEKIEQVFDKSLNYCPSCGQKLDKFFDKINPRWSLKDKSRYPVVSLFYFDSLWHFYKNIDIFCGCKGCWCHFDYHVRSDINHLFKGRKKDVMLVFSRHDGTQKKVILNAPTRV